MIEFVLFLFSSKRTIVILKSIDTINVNDNNIMIHWYYAWQTRGYNNNDKTKPYFTIILVTSRNEQHVKMYVHRWRIQTMNIKFY